jgi:hypothetical protein
MMPVQMLNDENGVGEVGREAREDMGERGESSRRSRQGKDSEVCARLRTAVQRLNKILTAKASIELWER